jgi:hypothetical protein
LPLLFFVRVPAPDQLPERSLNGPAKAEPRPASRRRDTPKAIAAILTRFISCLSSKLVLRDQGLIAAFITPFR